MNFITCGVSRGVHVLLFNLTMNITAKGKHFCTFIHNITCSGYELFKLCLEMVCIIGVAFVCGFKICFIPPPYSQ